MTVPRCSDVQEAFHKRMLEFRAVDALLGTERFEDAYARANESSRETLTLILKSGDLDKLRNWIRDRLEGPLKFASYRRLRTLAQKENIPRWSRMGRDELLDALLKKGME